MDLAAGPSARFQFASDQSLLVYFEQLKEKGRAQARLLQNQEQRRSEDRPLQRQVTLQANENVRKLLRLLQSEPVAGVHNFHPAYCSLLVRFDPCVMKHEDMELALRDRIAGLDAIELPPARTIELWPGPEKPALLWRTGPPFFRNGPSGERARATPTPYVPLQ